MHTVELLPHVGKYFDHQVGKVRSVVWKDIERLVLNGREIAKINKVPGAPIGIFAHIGPLTPSERSAILVAVSKARGGVPPADIKSPVKVPFELLDDEADDETDMDEGDDCEVADE